ncbi:MAG: dipeptide ABC transporter ATP-binding protein [Proteobacteria bacterium]|nr:dipeptide ABC transporter ATP-binding protein [Pseudomonadota bacterium]
MSVLAVEAKGISQTYPVGGGMFREAKLLRAVDGVSFTMQPGRTLAVVGESGSGKSTLARVVTMIEPPTAGSLVIDGHDISRASAAEVRQMRRAVQMVFQNPFGSLNPRKTVGDILAEPLIINSPATPAERTAEIGAMLAKVGLRPEHRERYPHMFSGGQRQRIAIARALMLRPKLVVADEPVSALDISIQAQVLNLMLDLQQEFGLAYLFISHDLSVVRHIADEVLVLYLGRPVEQGPKDLIFARPQHPYTRALLAATPSVRVDERRERHVLTGEIPSPLAPPSGCSFRTRCPFATEQCAVSRPESRLFDGRTVACHRIEEIASA